MHSDEISALDQVSAPDGLRTKTQVGDGHRAGFLRVVNKISLSKVRSFLADDLDRVFVSADCAVRAESPEYCAHLVAGLGAERWIERNAGEGNIVLDSN
jgi:hypothetical protein